MRKLSVHSGPIVKEGSLSRQRTTILGIRPADSRVGDEVHMLSGTRVPFVLRKVDGADDGRSAPGAEDDTMY
jgi:hypothetical protein